MYDNRAQTGGGETLPEEVLVRVGDAVETLAGRGRGLERTLADLQGDFLVGEPVQDRFETLLDREPALGIVGLVAWRDNLEPALDRLEAQGLLAESTRQEFEAFWAEVDWITDGVRADFMQERSGVPVTTDYSQEFERVDGVPVVHTTVARGLDRTERTDFVMSEVRGTADRLEQLLSFAVETGGPSQAAAADIVADARETLDEVERRLDELAAECADEDSPLGEATAETTATEAATEEADDAATSEEEEEAYSSLIGYE